MQNAQTVKKRVTRHKTRGEREKNTGKKEKKQKDSESVGEGEGKMHLQFCAVSPKIKARYPRNHREEKMQHETTGW